MEKIAECERGGRKAAWHPNSGASQLADHFSQRCVLASYDIHVVHTQVFERNYVSAVVFCVVHKSP
jgi:precorrin isomerase